jgi:hypothetical protein
MHFVTLKHTNGLPETEMSRIKDGKYEEEGKNGVYLYL